MNFNTSFRETDNLYVVTTPERIDAANSQELKDIVMGIVSKNFFRIVIDLSATSFIDSSGLGALVSKISICKNNGGDVRLVVTSKRVIEILQITHLDKILKCFDNLNDAVKSFKK